MYDLPIALQEVIAFAVNVPGEVVNEDGELTVNVLPAETDPHRPPLVAKVNVTVDGAVADAW